MVGFNQPYNYIRCKYLNQRSTNLFLKGQRGNTLPLPSYTLCCNSLTLLQQHKSSHSQHRSKRPWLFSNKTLFTKTGSPISQCTSPLFKYLNSKAGMIRLGKKARPKYMLPTKKFILIN